MSEKETSRFNISGKVEGGIVNIGGQQTISGPVILNIRSQLDRVAQTIPNLPAGEEARAELAALVDQLRQELEAAPTEAEEDVQVVSSQVETLVKEAAAEKPNKSMIKITAEGLKQAAENIAAVMPTVLTIATQIVKHVLVLAG